MTDEITVTYIYCRRCKSMVDPKDHHLTCPGTNNPRKDKNRWKRDEERVKVQEQKTKDEEAGVLEAAQALSDDPPKKEEKKREPDADSS